MKRTLALLAMAAALLGTAFAQNTAAGTSIRNQASATYLGLTTPVTSNEVFTVVQQVYSFTITPDGTTSAPGQTRSVLPGAKAYFAYRITNTGNGTDTISLSSVQDATTDNFNFSALTIYADGNCNGQLDVGESTTTSVSVDRLGAAVNFACVVIEATVPGTATNGQYGNYNLSGTSSGSTTDTNNWARANATTAAAIDISKSANPSGQVNPGANITYTITGQNRGGSAAAGTPNVVTVDTVASNGIFIEDNLPTGLTFVAGSLSASAGGGTITKIYKTATGWTATEPAAASVTAVGILMTGTGAFFPQNASYTMSFQATVPGTATPSNSYSNTATIYFNDNGTPTATNTSATSSATLNTVAPSYSVALGPDTFPTAGASGTYTAGAYTVTRAGDTQTIASAYSGTSVVFKHTLRNTGNTSDSFNLAIGTTPSGWTCQLVPSSGSGFISGAVGPVSAGSDFSFQVQCAIAAGSTSATTQSITVSATSVANSAQTDSTTDTVTAVVSGYSLDMAQRGFAGDSNAANDNFASQSADPGASLDYAIDVQNTGNTTDNYNLTTTLPSGWTVVYYNDANNNGTFDSGEAVVTSTGSLAAGSTAHLIARVTIAAGAAPSTGNTVTFTSTSSTLGTVTDSITASVTVNLVQGFSFTPDRNNTVTTPGTVTYTHSLQNNGNASATVSIPAFTSAWGWTYEFSTNGTTWTSSVSGLSLAAGGTASLYVRVQTPGGEPVGRNEAATFTATANYGSASATASVTDTTTIIAGNLQLLKDWTIDGGATYWKGDGSDASTPPQVAPGGNITYRIRASNIGTASLNNVKISDPLPANTNFVSVSATASAGTVLYSTDGSTWSATAPTTLATGGSVYVGVDTDANGTITSADAMAAGGTITITFVAQVK